MRHTPRSAVLAIRSEAAFVASAFLPVVSAPVTATRFRPGPSLGPQRISGI